MADKKHTSFTLSEEGHKAMRIEALKRGLTMNQLILQGLAKIGVDLPAEDLKS